MADKFPEIDDVAVDIPTNSDFLSREKELVGNEFTSEADADIMNDVGEQEAEDEDEEFEDFKSQFPEVGTTAAVTNEEEEEEAKEEEYASQNIVNHFNNLNLNDSEHIKEWKKTRELEISKRDEIAARKLQDIKQEAEKAIDDFYENYNNKKDDSIGETKKSEEEFLAKRDNFLENGTVWDRVIELLKLDKNSNAIDTENFRDKTKFRDLLLALKGKENVPGAAGI